jgi:hypothetical protein
VLLTEVNAAAEQLRGRRVDDTQEPYRIEHWKAHHNSTAALSPKDGKGDKMELRAGVMSPKEGFFDCNKCRHTVHFDKGDQVSPCSRCGGVEFGERLLNKAREWQKEDVHRQQ